MTVLESVRIGLKLQEARECPNPVPWKVLSKRFGLPVRTLQHQWSRHQERRAIFTDPSGVQVLRESAHIYAELLETALALVDQSKHPNVQIGAIRTAEKLLNGRNELFNLRYDHTHGVVFLRVLRELFSEFDEFIDKTRLPIEARDKLDTLLQRVQDADHVAEITAMLGN